MGQTTKSWLVNQPTRNQGFIAGFKGNQWVFISPDHDAGYFRYVRGGVLVDDRHFFRGGPIVKQSESRGRYKNGRQYMEYWGCFSPVSWIVTSINGHITWVTVMFEKPYKWSYGPLIRTGFWAHQQ